MKKSKKVTKRHLKVLCSIMLIMGLIVMGIPTVFSNKTVKAAQEQSNVVQTKQVEKVKELVNDER